MTHRLVSDNNPSQLLLLYARVTNPLQWAAFGAPTTGMQAWYLPRGSSTIEDPRSHSSIRLKIHLRQVPREHDQPSSEAPENQRRKEKDSRETPNAPSVARDITHRGGGKPGVWLIAGATARKRCSADTPGSRFLGSQPKTFQPPASVLDGLPGDFGQGGR